MFKDYPDVLNVKQLCEILHIGKNSAYELLSSGEIKSRKIGRKYLIPKICVIDFINSARYTSY